MRWAEKGLLAGKTVAVDSTMLEANAAMKCIDPRNTGEDSKEYLRRLAAEAGIENPTEEELRRFDRERKDKQASNEEWDSPTDPDSRIAKMKNGRTHLAYKAEHVIDPKSKLLLAASITTPIAARPRRWPRASFERRRTWSRPTSRWRFARAAADKGYRATETLAMIERVARVRTYIPNPSRGAAN